MNQEQTILIQIKRAASIINKQSKKHLLSIPCTARFNLLLLLCYSVNTDQQVFQTSRMPGVQMWLPAAKSDWQQTGSNTGTRIVSLSGFTSLTFKYTKTGWCVHPLKASNCNDSVTTKDYIECFVEELHATVLPDNEWLHNQLEKLLLFFKA